ncbi:hypothetical protein CYLTODRAFT_360742 [Cylindrobasidium torrendii FP15055 ss-10]|uniref:Dopa 4,5-dioxygenase n=1 Tax=Cylindrobasidium torrendii FP15055 ss-10 TaxID=1314674 RepID=A0A0D7AX38_9AGAR|nr:hypothetical protein CYLTODRAFT_360742 [Cylindrobasidium torrendii FP15055 ss-10]
MGHDWPNLLAGFENAPPLTEERNADGKSLKNLEAPRSKAYDEFVDPLDKKNNGFDFHIYYIQSDKEQLEFARSLHERIRREFPEMRIYRFWEVPVGPHPTAMFEVNVFDPHMTGTLFSWLAVNRGPCSVLIHPNTGDELKDHTTLATWMGQPWPLKTDIFH